MGLREKLKSIDHRQHVHRKADSTFNRVPDSNGKTAVPGGREIENDGGTIYQEEYTFPLSHRHGRICLGGIKVPGIGSAGLEVVQQMLVKNEKLNYKDLLFIDTETTGLGGTGSTVFLVGVGYFTGDGFIIKQFLMRDVDEEFALLTAIKDLIAGFTLLVSFNGKCFDIPVLNNRFILNRMKQLQVRNHLDLIYPARRIWSFLDSCSLGNLEQQILDIVRDDDLPGEEVPSHYFKYLREQNHEYLQPILRHNLIDVKSLVSLLILINRIYTDNYEIELSARELYNLARYQERKKLLNVSIKNYEKAYRKASGRFLVKEIEKKLSWQYKRAEKWKQAVTIWKKMIDSERGRLFPYIELAKYYEHKQNNFKLALDYTNEALNVLNKKRSLIKNWHQRQQELQHRRRRLQGKLE